MTPLDAAVIAERVCDIWSTPQSPTADEIADAIAALDVEPLRAVLNGMRATRESRPSVKEILDVYNRQQQPTATAVRYLVCEVCGDTVHEPGRWRHTDCPAPALPADAAEAIARLKGLA